MKTKKIYKTPVIEEVKLDSQISLQLVSHSTTPPPSPFDAPQQPAPEQPSTEQFGSNPWNDVDTWGK